MRQKRFKNKFKTALIYPIRPGCSSSAYAIEDTETEDGIISSDDREDSGNVFNEDTISDSDWRPIFCHFIFRQHVNILILASGLQ